MFRPIPPVGIEGADATLSAALWGTLRGSGAGMGVSAARSILTPDRARLGGQVQTSATGS